MSDFSIGDAVGSGFGLIAKRPVAVVSWGLVYLLILALPFLLVGAMMFPDFLELIRSGLARTDASQPPPPALINFFAKILLLCPLIMIATLLGRAVLSGAIFRAVLEPENKSWLSLRVGRQELWLAILNFAFGWVIAFAVIGIALAAALAGALGWAAAGFLTDPAREILRGVLVVAAVLAAIFGWIWVMLRLSLAFPMTFAEKEFRLFESWDVTKGHALKLLGLALVLFAIAFGVGLVMNIVTRVGMFSAIGGMDPDHLQSFAERVRASPQILFDLLAPAFGVFIVIELFLIGPFSTVLLAPWAYAYRELSKKAQPQHPPVF